MGKKGVRVFFGAWPPLDPCILEWGVRGSGEKEGVGWVSDGCLGTRGG